MPKEGKSGMGEATKVVIVNASPNGEYSLTLQYAKDLDNMK